MSPDEYSLLMRMSELWIAHIQDAAPDDPELEELRALRGRIVARHEEAVRNIPNEIIQIIDDTDPYCGTVTVTTFSDKPLKFLVEAQTPILYQTTVFLDECFPDMIVLAASPRHTDV